jgi:hypothetical protein
VSPAFNSRKANSALCAPMETDVYGAVSDASMTYTTSGFASLIACATLSTSCNSPVKAQMRV